MTFTLSYKVVEFDKKDEKGNPTGEKGKITNLYLVRDDGEMFKISPSEWNDKNGVTHNNLAVLKALATNLDKLPF